MKKPKIDSEIERVVEILGDTNPESEEYSVIVNNLKILCEARSKRIIIDWNILLPIVGNFLITGLVLNHEKFNIITTKASTFWRKV